MVAAAAYGIASLLPKACESTAWLRPVALVFGQSGQGVFGNVTRDALRAFLQSSEVGKWSAALGKQEAMAKLEGIAKASYNAKQGFGIVKN
jgi:hypothetical protein